MKVSSGLVMERDWETRRKEEGEKIKQDRSCPIYYQKCTYLYRFFTES